MAKVARQAGRADVHVIEPEGSEIWIDMRIHTAHVDQPIGRELLREEQQKCRAYGQTQGYVLNRLDHGMIPVVLEQHGRTAPGAQALFQRLLHHRAQSLVRQGLHCCASCSEQPGNPLQNVNLFPQWPGRRTVPNRPGRTPRSTHGPGPQAQWGQALH